MKIEFDTLVDTVGDARRLRELLTDFICGQEHPAGDPEPLPEIPTACPNPDKHSCDNKSQCFEPCGELGHDPAHAKPCDPALVAQVNAAVSFTPGDLSGAAPSGADAAQSPTAPEAPTAGVPVPPSDASALATAPVVPPVPAAPSSPAASAELDIHGLPWDERIHAGSKARNADGSWRQRRNLSPVTLETVVAELRYRSAAQGAIEASGIVPLLVEGVKASGILSEQPPAEVPPPPVTPELAAAAAPSGVTTQQFMEWLTPQMMAGKVTFAQVAEALKEHGMTSLGQLSTAPEHAGKADAVYRSLGGE